MPQLHTPPPPIRIHQHPYAQVLGALSTAMQALDDNSGDGVSRALEGIDFDLPSGAPSTQDRTSLRAAAALYFASELESAGVLPTAELIVGLYASGAIQQPLGPVAQQLHTFWQQRNERMQAKERAAIFARVLEAPHFQRLMRRLCEAIVAQADGEDARERAQLSVQTQALALFLAQRMEAMAGMAAKEIVAAINLALQFLRDRRLHTAFAVPDLWRLLELRRPSADTSAPIKTAPQSHAQRGQAGQSVLLWLADNAQRDAIALNANDAGDVAIMQAAQRWLSLEEDSVSPSGYTTDAIAA